MLDADPRDTLEARARRLADGCGGEVVASTAKVGGGALPLLELPGPAVAIDVALAAAAARRRPAAGRPHRRRPAAARRPHAHRRGGRPGGRRRPRRAGMTTAQPLTLGTAGHIDHGKTALVAALTGSGHRPPARREGARDLDRARLRAAAPDLRAPALGRRRARPRALRAHDGRRRHRHRPLPDGRRRRRRRDAPDARARRGARRARRGDGRRRGDQGRPRRPGARAAARRASCSRAPTVVPCSARTGAGRRGRARRPRRGRRPPARPRRERRRAAAARRPRLHHPRRRHRGDRHAVVGRDRARRPPGPAAGRHARCGSARCRSTTSPSSAPTRASASPSTSSASSGATSRAATWSPPPAPWRPRWCSTATLTLRDARHGMRAHVHHGTRETPARLADLGGGLWQARLEQPLLARAGDRVVVRSIAPPDTLGGGVVLDPAARRHGRRDDALARLERLRRGEPEPEPEPRRRAAAASRRPRPRRCPTRPSRSRSACAPPATSRRTPPTSRPTTSPPCAPPGAPCASGARCTRTPRRWRRCAPGSRPSSPPRARSRWRACATSFRPRASSPRRTSSTSTPSA